MIPAVHKIWQFIDCGFLNFNVEGKCFWHLYWERYSSCSNSLIFSSTHIQTTFHMISNFTSCFSSLPCLLRVKEKKKSRKYLKLRLVSNYSQVAKIIYLVNIYFTYQYQILIHKYQKFTEFYSVIQSLNNSLPSS